ncbi:MAG: Gfo/Idh/MocA family oxidoreductase [Rubripirellula sp.]|nr:Gfo/Idh/MocA family oxidoreductase [Rubripirellula sp.]
MLSPQRLIEAACNVPLPQDATIKIGCIGTGFIMADCHLPAYRAANLNLYAIAGRNLERTQQFAARHEIPNAYKSYESLLDDPNIEVVDIAVPPDVQLSVIKEVVQRPHVKGILAQKPLGVNLAEARQIVECCEQSGITLAVNQNMRFDQSVRAAKQLLVEKPNEQSVIGKPVLGTIDMRAIPHWMPWQQRQGWLTCRIMSIHHLDTMRYWFGDPTRVYASFAKDPRTTFDHLDGIGLYILEYDSGLRCQICDDVWTGPCREGSGGDLGIRWRIEGTHGLAKGTIGWPSYPDRTPSTITYTHVGSENWIQPHWNKAWFPDAFIGPMADLLVALETGGTPSLNGRDNLKTMALVDACYLSAQQQRSVAISELLSG